MIKSSHYNNNISNGSSLIVRVRYVYVHQHEARPFLEFRNRRVFSMLYNTLYPPLSSVTAKGIAPFHP